MSSGSLRPLRETRVRLEQRPDERKVVRVADDDRVRVPHRDGGHPETGDALGLVHLDRAHVLLDEVSAQHACDDLSRPDPYAHLVGARPLCEPARRDARAVPGELGGRAVGVPDHDLRRRAVDGHDLQDPVRIADLAANELRRQPSRLREQVDVPVGVPARRSHRRPRPAGGRRQR